MTLDQINAFVVAICKRQARDSVSYMDQIRFAYHAEQKDYTKQTRQLRREIQ